jgi:hypothetical protein
LVWSLLVATLSAAAQEPPSQPPSSAREVLATYGIGPAEFSQFVDGRALTDEETVLVKILYRFSRIGLENIHRWRKRGADWPQVAAAMHQNQGELFAIRGKAKLVTEHKLPRDLAEQLEFGRYYSVEIALDDAPQRAVVYTRLIPRAWQPGQPIDEPAIADGLLLKLGAPQGSNKEPFVFAAGRVGWLPDSSPLARAGFDVSLLDNLRETNGKGLVAADREPFYQLLAAIARVKKPATQTASPPLDLVGVLQQPADHHGQSVTVRGTARRIVKVFVNEVPLRERLGFDHYYEIDLFVPVGEARLRFDGANPAADGPTFENTYPVTLVARHLPAGLTPGENLHAQVAADAVFFKLWTYESIYMARHGRVQPAPLLVTPEPRLARAVRPDAGLWNAAITALLVGMLAATLAAWWWYRRGDRGWRANIRTQRSNLVGDSSSTTHPS